MLALDNSGHAELPYGVPHCGSSEAIRKMPVTLCNQLRRTRPSIGAWHFLIIRCRSRFLALRTRNDAVRRNTIGPILVTSPAPGTHLMPQERAHADEECNAHNERRHQHTQVPDHESALLSVCGSSFLSAWDCGSAFLLGLAAGAFWSATAGAVFGPKPNGDQLAFWPIAASSPPAPPSRPHRRPARTPPPSRIAAAGPGRACRSAPGFSLLPPGLGHPC
jgi:hypothetical protein